jgi:hypothetical protein
MGQESAIFGLVPATQANDTNESTLPVACSADQGRLGPKLLVACNAGVCQSSAVPRNGR